VKCRRPFVPRTKRKRHQQTRRTHHQAAAIFPQSRNGNVLSPPNPTIRGATKICLNPQGLLLALIITPEPPQQSSVQNRLEPLWLRLISIIFPCAIFPKKNTQLMSAENCGYRLQECPNDACLVPAFVTKNVDIPSDVFHFW
jgi:hypothetical protein